MISGIRTMRDSVTRLGTLSTIFISAPRRFVQVAVDALRERTADALHLGDIVDRGGLHAPQSAEMLDQRLAALGADARDLVEHRGGARLAAPRAVPDDGEAVRLVADRLDQVQAGVRRRELHAP